MNPRCQRGQSRSLSRGRGRGTFGDNWRPSILPPISWGGEFGREDLSEDSWHSLNRTWQSDRESFHTLSSGDSYRSLLSLFSDSEESVDEPEDRLLELLEEAEGIRDSLGTLETSAGVPRGRTSVQPSSRGLGTAGWAPRGRGLFQPGLGGLGTPVPRGGRAVRGAREHRGAGVQVWAC